METNGLKTAGSRVLRHLLVFALVVAGIGGVVLDSTEAPVRASGASVTLSTTAAGAQPILTVEYTLAQNSPANVLYLNKPSTYPSFTAVSGATFAGIITLWINGVQRNVADFLNPNAIWSSGIQIWADSSRIS